MESNGGAIAKPSALRFLLDTNAFIAMEPYSGDLEREMDAATTLVRLAQRQGHLLLVHPATRDELAGAMNKTRTAQRLAELAKFTMVSESPIAAALREAAGNSEVDTNDHRDLRILAGLHANAAHFLVSNDAGLRRRAVRAGVGDRVLTLADAAAMLVDLEPGIATQPPRVERIEAYALDLDQPLFDELRQDYAEFSNWINKVREDSENRACFVIREQDGSYGAIALVKLVEDDCGYALAKPVSKVSTFKVAGPRAGNRYGELLLKAVFLAHHALGIASTYVEVFPKHERLIDFLGLFGFERQEATTVRDELVFSKRYRPPTGNVAEISAFDYHVLYGPPAIQQGSSSFVIPIVPRWHSQLFPDVIEDRDDQLAFPELIGTTTHPWGNAIRKAYLCNAPTNQMRPGDTVLFYRSHGAASVTAVGVIEHTFRSHSADEVLNAVAGRTVYSREAVGGLCDHPSGVLVVLFRQDRLLDPGWSIGELIANSVVVGPPQTVTKVKERGNTWVNTQLVDQR
ncbi:MULTISPECIES: GNAT family N-acetyltransferase [Nocardiaceae]|uniref:rRNA-processing protein FCF1 n=1 Tax=Rhodococcoides corynebacterioides TaxID=53972 RepID=A0ABS2KY33_9NOCA|nr:MULTISPECIES: GNAT family N-acetyltransferase [Rhodococcus]MBM7416844.1 rRNA-processing protein FCF1 [Rhodococcus corynebacterioides]MBP1115097.1 rRNA-processing protein FCF1 [Rhodococcus sp. PvP016]